jgi:hypothetical protein
MNMVDSDEVLVDGGRRDEPHLASGPGVSRVGAAAIFFGIALEKRRLHHW